MQISDFDYVLPDTQIAQYPLTRRRDARLSDQRDKLERLCRYITRRAVSSERLSLTAQGLIHYRLKTPYRDGTTHVVFEPLDKIAGSDFEPPQAGPTGGGQDARNISSLGWRP